MQGKETMARISEWHRRLAQVMSGMEPGSTQREIIERALTEYARSNHEEILELMLTQRDDTTREE